MVSDQMVETLFDGDNENALWQKISLNINGNYQDFYIVGVYQYESEGTVSDSSEDVSTNAYIPLTTAKEIMHSDDGYTQFTIVTDTSVSSVSGFADQIEAFFTPYYMSNGTCGSDHCCGTVLHGRWRILWILSDQQSSQTGSNRGAAIRIV